MPYLESPRCREVAEAGRGSCAPAARAGLDSRCWSPGGLEGPQSKAGAAGVGGAFETLKTVALHLLPQKHLVFLRTGLVYPAGNTGPAEGQGSKSEGLLVRSPAGAAWLPAGAISAAAWPGSALGAGWWTRGPRDFQATSGTPDGLPAASATSLPPCQRGQCSSPSPDLAAQPACPCLCLLRLCGNSSADAYPAKLRTALPKFGKAVLLPTEAEQRTKTSISCLDAVVDERADK